MKPEQLTQDDVAQRLHALAGEALPVEADGCCPFCLTGRFAPSQTRPDQRVLCRVRLCRACGVVLRWGDVPDFQTRQTPRVLNALGGQMDKEHLGTSVLYGRTAFRRSELEETVDGLCPSCRHAVPRRVKGTIKCPCGAKVTLTGRTADQVTRDRLQAIEEGRR